MTESTGLLYRVVLLCTGLAIWCWPAPSPGAILTLRNGMQLEGRVGKIASMGDSVLNPSASGGEVDVKQIVLLDDNLRRMFVSSIQVQSTAESAPFQEKIEIQQRVATNGRRIAAVGPIVRLTPFDQWGRRILSMNMPDGKVDVVQGITEITPTYTKVEGLTTRTSYLWDMRVATSSIPRETLSKVIKRQLDPDNPDERLRIVRLYIQAERYQDARSELQEVLKDFPELKELQNQVQGLYQMGARRLIQEVELRRQGGQHRLAYQMLEGFPDEGVAGETLLKVREMLGEYGQLQEQGQQALQLMETHLDQLDDSDLRERLEPVRQTIASELNIHTLPRMADYLRLADDEQLQPDQKLALAISGWLLGSGAGTENVAVALSLVEVRDLVAQYLASERHHDREAILEKLKTLEGGTPADLARLVAHMKPAVETVPSQQQQVPGLFELTIPGLPEDPEITYHVQLPPEYDPYHRYGCIVTLNGAGSSEQQQIDWWAGGYNEEAQIRTGQAARRGYIVIAPQWTKPHQKKYQYSAREHAAVLYSLRDACRRFSIDTDRVFLSGHSMGGDAAWDIALAHPDMWAGVIPIVATADKFVSRYWENARHVLPMYFVNGQLDGNRISHNAQQWDRYMSKAGYDVIVVEYLGRGHEHFHDEIQRLFQWMELQRRDFFPSQFKCVAMRPWDNFFWWAEVDDYPSRSMVAPLSWPPQSNVLPIATEGRILENNRIHLRTGARRAIVWLAPEMVDFQQRIVVTVNGRSRSSSIEPSAEVLLEDVRTRGDRQHPFWAKVEMQTGRVR